MHINRGQFVSIMGPSGSGKTTLLNLIGALDRPTSGKVYLDGQDLTKIPERELHRIRREKIGFVFQHFYLVPTLTSLENVMLPVIPLGRTEVYESRAKKLLEEVGLGDRLDHKPSQLSGGEQQRVAICRALINSPKLLLCDEPTAELDSKTGKMIINVLKELNRNERVTVIVVTHDPKMARLARSVITLADGKIRSVEETKKSCVKPKKTCTTCSRKAASKYGLDLPKMPYPHALVVADSSIKHMIRAALRRIGSNPIQTNPDSSFTMPLFWRRSERCRLTPPNSLPFPYRSLCSLSYLAYPALPRRL
ncbi:MAG: putative ABC transporter ATP-binding protein [Candidatus Bathyarchaeota archaeon BA1]|nr:MAG: putative ABC transporter ATP-binding protein [Candidatus Bathyarchaeota archaeon BA1]